MAVFGASNFPLAFSTAGGDTASALAAGCPVVVKAHPGHMATAELTAEAIVRAVARCGLPGGVFNMIFGTDIGAELVRHPAIQPLALPAHWPAVRRCINWRSSVRSQSRCLLKCRRLTR